MAARHTHKIDSELSDAHLASFPCSYVELDVRTLYLKDLSLFGCTVLEPEVFNILIKRIEQGTIKPIVAQSFSLEEICDAQTMFLKKQHVGKIVLRI